MSHFRVVALTALCGLVWPAASGSAQTIGTFRWQSQPYCNVLTFTVIGQGPSYLLTGTDDLCGTGTVATAIGSAAQNADGSIAMGFSVITPTGATAHINATLSLATISGTWQDADGHSGPFVFSPQTPGGPPRPAPTRSSAITSAQLAPSIFAGTGTATTLARSDHTHDDRYFTQAQVNAIVAAAGAAVVEGPGTNVPTLVFSLQTSYVAETVTIPTTGRLLISKSFSLGNFTCTGLNTGHYLFLALDGVPIPSSLVRGSGENFFAGHLTGVTTNAVLAGPHVIRVAVQCVSGTFLGSSSSNASKSSVVVLP